MADLFGMIDSAMGSAGNAGAAALHLAQSLRAAAQQQQQQQIRDKRAEDQRRFENDLQLSTHGAIPADVSQQTYTDPKLATSGSGMFGLPVVTDAAAPQKGLVRRVPNPEAQGAGIRTRAPGGDSVYLPTDEEKALKGGKSITLDEADANAINGMLNTKAYKPGQVISAEHHATLLEKAKKSLGDMLDDNNSVQLTEEMANRLSRHGIKVKPGARMSLEKLANLRDLAAIAEPKALDKPDAQSILPGQQGPNGGVLVFNKNSQTIDEIPVPKGSKAVLTPVQAEADKDRHIRRTELEDLRAARNAETQGRIRDRAQGTIDKLQQQEQQQHALRREYGDFLSALGAAEDGGTVVLPGSKTPVTVTPARTKSLADKYKTELNNATEKAKMYNEQARKLVQAHGLSLIHI